MDCRFDNYDCYLNNNNDLGIMESTTVGNLLWQNSNTTSNFEEQNITLSNSNYDYLKILFFNTTDNDIIYTVDIFKGLSGQISWSTVYCATPATNRIFRRDITYISDTIYKIGTGIYGQFDTSKSTYSKNNKYCIPYKIYGYKFVSN